MIAEAEVEWGGSDRPVCDGVRGVRVCVPGEAAGGLMPREGRNPLAREEKTRDRRESVARKRALRVVIREMRNARRGGRW
jgi:hypothetical protein